jgi:hypothetical protein
VFLVGERIILHEGGIVVVARYYSSVRTKRVLVAAHTKHTGPDLTAFPEGKAVDRVALYITLLRRSKRPYKNIQKAP